MGKEITHILFADETIRGLTESRECRSIPEFSQASLDFGSISPDIFFYAIRIPFLERGSCGSGEIIHGANGNDTGIISLNMLRQLRSGGSADPLFGDKFAFACGYLTHVAFDSVFHPYIYYISGDYYHSSPEEKNKARTRHRLFESWLDVYLLAERGLVPGNFERVKSIRDNRRLNMELLKFMYDAFSPVAENDSACDHLIRGYKVQMLLNSMYPKTSWGKVFSRLNRLVKGKISPFVALFYPWNYKEIPAEVIGFESYLHPVTGCEVRENFEALWRRAGLLARSFLLAAADYVLGDGDERRFREVVKGYNLSMGMVGVRSSEAKHFKAIPLLSMWSHGAPASNLLTD